MNCQAPRHVSKSQNIHPALTLFAATAAAALFSGPVHAGNAVRASHMVMASIDPADILGNRAATFQPAARATGYPAASAPYRTVKIHSTLPPPPATASFTRTEPVGDTRSALLEVITPQPSRPAACLDPQMAQCHFAATRANDSGVSAIKPHGHSRKRTAGWKLVVLVGGLGLFVSTGWAFRRLRHAAPTL
jgi:hypothetical protein